MSIEIIFSIVILIISVVIHEVSHGYSAYMQGDNTAYYAGRLTLNPLKHLDWVGSVLVPIVTTMLGFPFGWAKPVPFNPYNLKNQRWGELLVAIAGPLSNIAIAIVFGLIVRFGFYRLTPGFLKLSAWVVFVNLWLAIFNLLPLPPLDGSRILFSLLPYQSNKFRQSLEKYSFLLLILIVFIIPQFSQVLSVALSFSFGVLTGHSPLSLGFVF